jgi:hypothetical protein|tara:strand:- start:784 stop:3741 length:2958 start_codon:yes stop_codon:yes gene_type:complete
MGYQKINNLTGWIAFLIALIVYTLTVEPTASFWDCGEFIATSFKLEVPHPPGAPFFLLMGRLFSMLAGDNLEQVAFWVNMLSVLSGAFTVLFLFWSITHLSKKMLVTKGEELTTGQTIAIMGSGLVGGLVCTFSDSIWFSAVEAEVYAMSSFFTAFVFWAILKWETIDDESEHNKWLILIAYMMGLSIGVHLLNLVTIPALGLIVYFKYTQKITQRGLITTLLICGAIIITVLIGIIPGIPSTVGGMEVFFVNSLGLPFGSGAIAFVLIFVGLVIFGIYYSILKEKLILNTAMLAFAFMMIGYMSYAIVLIRSNYDTPIDENNPEDIMNYVSYLKREQYGSRPLFHGQYYTAEIIPPYKQGEPVYRKGKEKYEIIDYKVEYTYDPSQTTILPRMYSKSPQHEQKYREITGLAKEEKPSFSDNIYFMLRHQLGTMYLRYFLWNFSGRASDIQDAQWIGIVDAFEDLPDELANNEGRNIYFGLPLLLGLIGLLFQFKKSERYFWVTLLLFFLTGAALVLYLNSPPIEPRERDYIYAGSYYVFAIWIGFSVLALYELLLKVLKNKTTVATLATLICLGVPTLMAAENWDDHDRSDRYFSVDAAKNYLDSCAPNAILFTGGDNDTFPLWFVQEVLGHRTDVRVIVLSYFNTDWYIEQMMRDAYESKALPFGLSLEDYQQGGPNDYLPYYEIEGVSGPISASQFLKLIKEKHPALTASTRGQYNSLPAKELILKLDSNKVKELSWLYEGEMPIGAYQTNNLSMKLKGLHLEKKDLAILDLIVNSNWSRPIYFNNTSLNSFNLDIRQHVVQEGLTYRLAPIKNPSGNMTVNADLMFDNIVNKFHYRGLDDPEVYYTEDYRNFVLNHRSAFNTLATTYLNQGNEERAKEVLIKGLEYMPDDGISYDIFNVQQIGLLMAVGERDLALDIAEKFGSRAEAWLSYASSNGQLINDPYTYQQRVLGLNEIARAFRAANDSELAAKYEGIFNQYYKQ